LILELLDHLHFLDFHRLPKINILPFLASLII